jgi:hypothetical protein
LHARENRAGAIRPSTKPGVLDFHPVQISAQQRESHIREAAAAMALALAFLRNRMGLVSSPPKPVSEFAPTRLKQVKDARKQASLRAPPGSGWTS